jgi:hypothetical protein
VQVGAGYTVLSDRGDLLGIARESTWSVAAGLSQGVGRRLALTAAASLDSSPLAGFAAEDAGRPALFATLGVALRVAERTWLSLQYGGDRNDLGLAPDVSFRLALGIRGG